MDISNTSQYDIHKLNTCTTYNIDENDFSQKQAITLIKDLHFIKFQLNELIKERNYQYQLYKQSFSSSVSLLNKQYITSINEIQSIYIKLKDILHQYQNQIKMRNDYSNAFASINNYDSYTHKEKLQLIQNHLIRPEHHKRKEVQLSIKNQLYSNHMSPWEQTDFKFQLLESLVKKLQLKLIFYILKHNNIIHKSRLHMINLCLYEKQMIMKKICYLSLIINTMEAKQIELNGMLKTRKFILLYMIHPVIQQWYYKSIYSKQYKLQYIKVKKYYITLKYQSFIYLLKRNVKVNIRKRILMSWSSKSLSLSIITKALYSWIYAYINTNKLKVSLIERLNKELIPCKFINLIICLYSYTIPAMS